MKLVTFEQAGSTGLGAVLDDMVVDLAAAYAELQPQGVASAEALADMQAFVQGGEDALQTARSITEQVSSGETDIATYSFVHPLAEVKIGPPLPNPGKVICIGLNYADHSYEQDKEPPTSPVIFAKFPSSVIGPGESITWPAESSEKVDYEAELAVVIGREARAVSADDAFDYVAGYTIVNDVSARDAQFSDGQWVRGKSFDTFCPMGPYLVTPDEVGDPHQLSIGCRVNGEQRQDSHTSKLIFNIPFLIAYISKTCTLLPGDIISTGTPHGVGVFMDPPVFLKPGDEVIVEIEKLGSLRNPVA